MHIGFFVAKFLFSPTLFKGKKTVMNKKLFSGKNCIPLFIYFLICFPFGYYSYKFGSPDVAGQHDFYSYYPLYKNFDISAVESPFNMRLVSSFFIFALNKTGLFYDVKISYAHSGIGQKTYFSAVFFNYLSAVLTCFVVFLTVRKFHQNQFFSFTVGSLYLFQYGTIFWGMGGLADGFSAFLFALIFYFYISRSYWILPLLAVSVLQREIIFLSLAPIAFVEYFFNEKKKYFVATVSLSVLFFAIYLILRKTVFFTPRWSAMLSTGSIMDMAFYPTVGFFSYVRQSILTQNILALYFFVILYKVYKKITINKANLLVVVALFAEINLISFAFLAIDNAGRYFYISSAAMLFFLAYELKPLLIPETKDFQQL